MGLVLVGTLFPLAYEAVTGGDKISVGVPYFNFGFVPLMGLLAVALGFVYDLLAGVYLLTIL